ncbi:hypothetical protein SEVIR_9G220600v4 [Setaria viridis]|uniref:MATH domain-containing protein n=1 Tax=Setaria viridis TaxID=4556 RepID=A0A4U6SXX3_SETVI|nr:uncharacterized protein LOC117838008 [Setaria viridis]TKV93351.1 hypothetical protein SEVIR_9G220600v2 [Setaria viridis]
MEGLRDFLWFWPHRGFLGRGIGRAMGNSCLTVSPAEQTTFKWTIDGFSSLLNKGEGWTYSGAFKIMDLNWYLMLNLRDKKSGDQNDYVSMRLGLSKSSMKPDTIVEACFKFMIYDQFYGKHRKYQVKHNFETGSTSTGIACMIPLDILKEQSSGFFIGDTCVFGVKFIKVVTAKADMISQTLFVRKTNTFNEAKTYTWNIEDFFALKNTSCSPEFEISGYNWFHTFSFLGLVSLKLLQFI